MMYVKNIEEAFSSLKVYFSYKVFITMHCNILNALFLLLFIGNQIIFNREYNTTGYAVFIYRY